MLGVLSLELEFMSIFIIMPLLIKGKYATQKSHNPSVPNMSKDKIAKAVEIIYIRSQDLFNRAA